MLFYKSIALLCMFTFLHIICNIFAPLSNFQTTQPIYSNPSIISRPHYNINIYVANPEYAQIKDQTQPAQHLSKYKISKLLYHQIQRNSNL